MPAQDRNISGIRLDLYLCGSAWLVPRRYRESNAVIIERKGILRYRIAAIHVIPAPALTKGAVVKI